MKKWLLVLGMITCILGVSACGKVEDTTAMSGMVTEADALQTGDSLVESIALICTQNMQEQYSTDPVIAAALQSWTDAQNDIGSYEKILDHTAEINEDGVVLEIRIKGTEREGKVEIVFDETLALTSITTSPIYSFGESMEKAALNTLLGMGTVFVILILISGIIYCFTFIPKIQAAFTQKPKEETKPAAVDNTIAQIIEKEESSDGLELAAVIAAAIAASEGSTSTDGFVVRSIRKRRTF